MLLEVVYLMRKNCTLVFQPHTENKLTYSIENSSIDSKNVYQIVFNVHIYFQNFPFHYPI